MVKKIVGMARTNFPRFAATNRAAIQTIFPIYSVLKVSSVDFSASPFQQGATGLGNVQTTLTRKIVHSALKTPLDAALATSVC